MKHSKRFLNLLFMILGVTMSAEADTSILAESDGWKKITEMPTSIGDYYYALVDHTQDLMLTMDYGKHQGSSYRTMYYKASQNPLENKAALWTIESDNYTFRNVSYTIFAMQTEYNAPWHYRTHDQRSACEWTATTPAYYSEESYWTIQNGKYPTDCYLGPWNNTIEAGAEVAFNKSGDAIGKFQIYAIPKIYCSLTSLIALCNEYVKEEYSTVNSEDTRTTFQDAISTAETSKGTTTTIEGLNSVYTTLETARQTYVDNATPVSGNYFDLTFKMTNAAVASTNGWTNSSTYSNYEQYNGAPDAYFLDSNGKNPGDMYQELTGLPTGIYTVTAAGRAHADCPTAYIYLNNTQANFTDKVGNSGNDLENGWKWYTTDKTMVTDGTAKIGFYSVTTSSYAGADDFKLYYYGPDNTEFINEAKQLIETLKTKASELLLQEMNAEIKEALQQAMPTDYDNASLSELNTMAANLNSAIANAEASIADYEKIAAYIAKAKVFDANLVTDYETNYRDGKYTADDVETVRQQLNVATADYVTKNFKNEMALTDWNGNMIVNTTTIYREHWSGVADSSYYDKNGSDDATMTKTVTLKPDTYIFKSAGRAYNTSKLSISINIDGIDPITFNAKGNTGYGIDTNGNATFEADSTYANSGKGYGWEWDFMKFTLEEETEITLTATYSNGGWASFGNCSLLCNTKDVDVTISADNMWSTCVLPFNTTLPEGLRAFASKELTATGLLLTEVTGSLEAYTPYILYAKNGFNGTLSGTVDLTNYQACPYDNIALYGAIEKQTITGGYVLQNQQSNGVKFHKIPDNKEVTIPVGKCWLVVPQTSSASLQQSVPLRFEGGTTGIKGVELDTEVMFNAADGIYTLDGKRVEEMENGNIYIVGGKKILYMENK